MQTVRFLTKGEDGRFTQWCITNQQEMFFRFIQYVLDSCSRPEEYIVYDETNRKAALLMSVAEHYGMRKRTPEERIKNIKTHRMEDSNETD